MCCKRAILALALMLAAAQAAACTPHICSRSTDCSTGLICTTIGLCAIPMDAATDDAIDAVDASITVIGDAPADAPDDAPADAAGPTVDADLGGF